MIIKRPYANLFLLSIFIFSNLLYLEPTAAQKDLLENLPPDQREAVLAKMEIAEKGQAELDEIFEEGKTLTQRPELSEQELEDKTECEECIFGYDFFKYSPTTFAPTSSIPISSDYILGPGDKLEINYYGNVEETSESFISREGNILLPIIGPVNLLGMNFEDATILLKNKVKTQLIGTELSISLKDLRSISVYMLGEAYKPGLYTMSGLSTVSNALYVSGGVNENGSLRNIQIIRNNKTIGTYDFYNFLLNGSLDNDLKLLDGDIVLIPFIEDTVEIGGAFKRPHRYEFLKGETVGDAVELAGGYAFNVDPKTQIELSYIDADDFSRKFKYLDKEGDLNRTLNQGDVLNIFSKSGILSQTIKLTGEINFPGEYSIQEGDSILDIIDRAGGFTEQGYSEGAVFLRKKVAEIQRQAFARSADELEKTLVDIISNNSIENITEFTLTPISQLIVKLREEEPIGRMVVNLNYLTLKTSPELNFKVQGGDELHIPKRPNSISVTGEVLISTTQVFNPELGVDDYLKLSGGLTDSADSDKIFIILPDGRAELVQRSLFSSKNILLPGSAIVVSRDSRPFDAINLTQIITPILADLATSAAAIAAISD